MSSFFLTFYRVIVFFYGNKLANYIIIGNQLENIRMRQFNLDSGLIVHHLFIRFTVKQNSPNSARENRTRPATVSRSDLYCCQFTCACVLNIKFNVCVLNLK